MKNKILKITLLFVVILLGLLTVEVNAAYKSNDPTVTSGGTITITVKSTESLENYDISLKSYTGLTYVSCSAENAAVNSSAGKISFATLGTGATTLGTFTFKAPEVTETKKYSVVFNINDGETTNTSTVTVNPVKTQTNTNTNTGSNNAGSTTGSTTTQEQPKKEEVKKGTIDTFYINGIKVKQFLNVTNKDSVSIKVNTSTKEGATVYNSLTKKSYTLKSGESKNIQILEGTNTLTITLETGHKETRKIYSQKEEVVEPNVIEEKEEEKVEKVLLKSLVVKAVKSEEEKIELSLTPEFASEVYEYNALLDEVLTDVTKLEIDAVATNDDFTVEIAGNENLKVGHNTINIIVKSKDGKTTTTYKVVVTKLAKVVPVVAEPTVEVEQEVVKPLWNRTQQILITVFTSIITMMGIAYAIIEYRYKKEPEIKIPYSGLTLEEEMNKEVEGSLEDNIPFAKVAFEKENTDKIDVLKDEKEEEEVEEKVKEKPRRGKHF